MTDSILGSFSTITIRKIQSNIVQRSHILLIVFSTPRLSTKLSDFGFRRRRLATFSFIEGAELIYIHWHGPILSQKLLSARDSSSPTFSFRHQFKEESPTMAPPVCPGREGRYTFYHYSPSLPAAAIFTVLFFISTAWHIWQTGRKRSWFMIAFIIGGISTFTLSFPSIPNPFSPLRYQHPSLLPPQTQPMHPNPNNPSPN